MTPMHGNNEERLDALFRAYASLPTPEASANFMPGVWQKIEARQTFTWSLGKMANFFVTAAAALTLALGVITFIPKSTPAPSQTYLDVLAEAQPIDTSDIVSPVRFDLSESAR